MPELVVYPDEIDLFAPYLKSRLLTMGVDISVSGALPAVRPAESVVIILTGGRGKTDALISTRAQLSIDSRANLDSRARLIAERVRALMNAAPQELTAVASVEELANPSSLPDLKTPDAARYTQTFVVHLTGSIL